MRLLIAVGSSLRRGPVEREKPVMTGAAAKWLEYEEQMLQRSPAGANNFTRSAMRALSFFSHSFRPRYQSKVIR
jgi:hypothetical protein